MNSKIKHPLTIDEAMRIRKCMVEYTEHRRKGGPKFTCYERAGLIYLAQLLKIGMSAHPASLASLVAKIQQRRNRMWRIARK